MREYEKPIIKDEEIALDDIIMISNQNILGEIIDDDGEVFPHGN